MMNTKILIYGADYENFIYYPAPLRINLFYESQLQHYLYLFIQAPPPTLSHSVWRSGVMRPLKDRSGVHRIPPMPEPVSRKPLFGSDGRLTCAFNTCRRDSPAYAPLATEDNDSSPDESLWDEDR